MTRKTGTLRDLNIFMIVSGIILRIRNVSDRSFREDSKAHFMLSMLFPENFAVNEVMWENMAELVRPQ